MRAFPLVVLAGVLAALPTVARGQCVSVSGTGCPGATPVQCSGSAQIGQVLTVSCLTTGRELAQVLLAGGCAPVALPAPPALLCVPGPCFLGVDPTSMVAIPTGFNPIPVPVPNVPALIGRSVCLQCVDVIQITNACLALSEAAQVTIS